MTMMMMIIPIPSHSYSRTTANTNKYVPDPIEPNTTASEGRRIKFHGVRLDPDWLISHTGTSLYCTSK